jgi:hypothetical protein
MKLVTFLHWGSIASLVSACLLYGLFNVTVVAPEIGHGWATFSGGLVGVAMSCAWHALWPLFRIEWVEE